MVATAAQIAANRANARRSTGPRTPEGKAASSRNALSHGAYAGDDTILATGADVYLEDFRAHFQPIGVLEAHLVEHLAVLASRRDRLAAALDALLELNERHALTEHLHERYGINEDHAYIDGQPSWLAAMRRYDGNTYIDDRFPEPVSDPALDPDPILCSLAYTLSGPRAALLFPHEASVDRRFTATLKELTALQAQRYNAGAAVPTAAPRRETRPQPASDPYPTRTHTAPASQPAVPTAPPAPTRPALTTPAAVPSATAVLPGTAGATPACSVPSGSGPDSSSTLLSSRIAPAALFRPSSSHQALVPAQTPACLSGLGTAPQDERYEPNATAILVGRGSTPIDPASPECTIEANPASYLAEDSPTTFLSVLPRSPHHPSSIPAHWPGIPLSASH
jgi:hypothetical protein